MLFALLTVALIFSIDAASKGKIIDFVDTRTRAFVLCGILWALWAAVFYTYLRGSSAPVKRLVAWLLCGSVLELLIAVPAHVIVRRRHECCAPMLTSFGIVTGIAVMLISFGPGVLLLYKKRLDSYKRGKPVSANP